MVEILTDREAGVGWFSDFRSLRDLVLHGVQELPHVLGAASDADSKLVHDLLTELIHIYIYIYVYLFIFLFIYFTYRGSDT